MAKGLNVYIGNPNQQKQVKQQLRTSLEQHTGGIYIIGGPNMVGKDYLIDEIASPLNPARMSMVHTTDDPETLGLQDWLEDEYANGKRVYVLGEMQQDFQDMFRVLNEFYQSKKTQEPITVFFSLLSREYPAWHNQELKIGLKKTVQQVLPEAHFFYLESDPLKIPESVWELHTTNKSMFDSVVIGLGLSRTPQWEETVEQLKLGNRERFDRQMGIILEQPPISSPPEIR